MHLNRLALFVNYHPGRADFGNAKKCRLNLGDGVMVHRAEIQKEREKLARARRIHNERFQKVDRENREALAKWQQAVDKALLEGEDPPEKPEPKTTPGNAALFMNRDIELRELERAFIRNHSGQLEAKLVQLHDSIIEHARPRVMELQHDVSELRAVVEALRKVRGVTSPGAPKDMHPGGDHLDIAELVLVVVRGGSFVHVEPPRHIVNRIEARPGR